MDLDALKTELVDDPLGRGYSAMTDEAAAVDLNTLNRERDVVSVTGQQIFEAVVPAEYTALTDIQRQTLLGIVGMGEILVNGINTKAALLSMFSPGVTRTNLSNLQKESIGRATELGLGFIRAGDVQRARA